LFGVFSNTARFFVSSPLNLFSIYKITMVKHNDDQNAEEINMNTPATPSDTTCIKERFF